MRRTETLIVGGGPAGASAAIALARGGARPVLIERLAVPRQGVCGGFLGGDALATLGRLGIDARALGAQPIRRLRLVSGRRCVEAALPFPAAGLSRRTLDTALLCAAEQAGADVRRGRSARAADRNCVRLDDGTLLTADALFLATGKHELRGLARPIGRRPVSVGLRATVDGMAALEGVIELHLFEGGYAGLLLQEDGRANLCLSVAPARIAAAGGPQAFVRTLLRESALLAHRIGGDVPSRWEAVAGIPYGWRARAGAGGLYRLGDQMAVIASLAGDGIAIALASGEAAAAALLCGHDGARFQRRYSRRAAAPLAIAEAARRAAEHAAIRPILMKMAGIPGLPALIARLTRAG